MRKIKFRAWLKKEKRMLYDFRGWFDMPEGRMVCLETEDSYYTNDFESLPEEEAEFMQSTGLKDEKRTKEYPEGQEIFEGDIVKLLSWIDKDVVVIKFGEYNIGEFEYALGWYFYVKRSGMEYPFIEFNERYEIIGNKFENPELLK